MELEEAMQVQAKALADKSRFRIFRFIAEADDAVGVPELTDLLGFNHNAIRQHLALLVEAGLIVESTEQRKVRGRPRKQYSLRADALSAFRSVGGSYERLAALLLDVTVTGDTPYEVGQRAGVASAAKGAVEQRQAVTGLLHQLAVDGFEPARVDDDRIMLAHCPFADVAAKNPGVVCELHRGLIQGHLASAAVDISSSLEPKDPHQAGCCVVLRGVGS